MANQSLSEKENWLLRFLAVQKASDAQVAAVLQAALDSLDKHLSSIEAKPGVGAAVRRAQLLGNRGVITMVLSSLYKNLGDVVREGQANAAQAATEAELYSASKIYDRIIEDPAKRDVLKRSLEQTSRRNIQVTVTRMTESQRPLSKRLYRSQAISKGQVSKVINNHLAKGSSAADMAKDLRAFFNPKVPGGVSFRAQTLARTEINNAFHAQAAADMADRPWVNQCRWHLSGSHKVPDECNAYASTALFPVDSVPKKPHPNCLCYITPDLPDVETVINDYLAGKYNSWLAEHTDDGLRRSA